jgi:hypothetical protein
MGNVIQRIGGLLLYGGSLALREYERQCIWSWIATLPSEANKILSLQMAKLDRYKRLDRDRILQLFPTGWPNGVPLPTELRVPLREDESRVARLQLTIGGPNKFACDVVVVMQNGQLTSLEFSKSPPRTNAVGTEIHSIQHLRDVLRRTSDSAAEYDLAGFRQRIPWLADQPIGKIVAPRPREEVREFLTSFQTTFPREYAELLTLTNGFSIGPLTIYGLGDVWSAPHPDGPFVIFGNVLDVGDLACKNGESDGEVYLLNMEADEISQLSHPLVLAIQELSLKSTSSKSDKVVSEPLR